MLGRRTAAYRLRQYADNPRKEGREWLIVGDMRNKGLSKKQRKHYTVLMGQIKIILSVMIVHQTLSPCIKNKPEMIRYATQYHCKVFPNNELDLTTLTRCKLSKCYTDGQRHKPNALMPTSRKGEKSEYRRYVF